MLTLDMRGKVPYECKSHVYRNRVFWMDDISFSIFLRGLDKNNLVYTNEVYEEIINGKAAFFAPEMRTSPLSGPPPVAMSLSMERVKRFIVDNHDIVTE